MSVRFRFLSPATWVIAAAALAADQSTPKVEYFAPAAVDAARAAGETGSAIITNSEYKVLAARRDKPGQAEIHVSDTDIFIVIDGTATLVIGGKLVDAKEISPGEIRGSGIEGGTDYKLEKGVVLTVPRNTPHWVRQTQPGFRYYVVKSVARS
jgi:mannose-6-phosphate isomerase-like protein (cupin superfamily)